MSASLAPAALLVAGSLLGTPIQNARIETVPLASGGLGTTVRSLVARADQGSWIAWAAPAVADYEGCCWRSRQRGCCLDGDSHGCHFQRLAAPRSSELLVLLRVSGEGIDRVAAYSVDCPLDGAGRTLYWLDPVAPRDSVEFLTELLDAPRIAEGVVAAIAFHAVPEAGALLARLGQSGASAELRRDALFWLAQRNGEEAPEVLLAAAASDPDPEVREHAVFAMSQLPHETGTLLLLRLARDRAFTNGVRQQAIFWLAQSSDPRALDLFAEILRGNG